MRTITRESVLEVTCYGLQIYDYILQKFYPCDGNILREVSSWDYGFYRNPFAGGAASLHIWVEKSNPNDPDSMLIAKHTTTDNSIPDGDAIMFAFQYYKRYDILETLNREMFLFAGDTYSLQTITDENGREITRRVIARDPFFYFSFFKSPITNVHPCKNISLLDAYKYIVSDKAKDRTEKLRSISDPKEARKFKASNFDYCTFSGLFDIRSDKALIQHSGYLCIDFDHVDNYGLLRNFLLNDRYFETLLLFRSPSGNGLKWVIKIDIGESSHSDYCRAVFNYIFQEYGLKVDEACKDVSRACFLPYDPDCYIKQNYLLSEEYGKSIIQGRRVVK